MVNLWYRQRPRLVGCVVFRGEPDCGVGPVPRMFPRCKPPCFVGILSPP